MCLIFYGLPLCVYLKFTLKAFTVRVFESLGECISNSLHCFLFRTLSIFIIFCAWLIHSFMLCTIFLDAVIFISRIFVYSYEGTVLYPKISLGIPVMRYERAARPCALNFRLAALKCRFGRPPNALSSVGV